MINDIANKKMCFPLFMTHNSSKTMLTSNRAFLCITQYKVVVDNKYDFGPLKCECVKKDDKMHSVS